MAPLAALPGTPGDAIASDPIPLYPPGPFPPHGDERPGTVDLGIRLREIVFTRSILVGPARNALAARISDAAKVPARLVMVMGSIDALLDTWPLASMIDEARQRWAAGPDGWALAVLARCATVLSPVLGWPAVVDRRWLLPGLEDLRQVAGDGEFVVIPRGPADGAPAVAIVLDAPLGPADPWPLPPVRAAHGDELTARRDELLAMADQGEASAFRFESPVPWDEASRDALEKLHDAVPAQRAFERYGHAGLVAPDAPLWEDVLSQAPIGREGPFVRCTGDLLVLPTLEEGGRVAQFGAVVWDAPYQPVRLVAAATAVLQRLDGNHTAEHIADELEVKPALVRNIIRELVKVGAASA